MSAAYDVDVPAETVEPRASFDAASGQLGADAVEAFTADGVVCLRNVLSVDQVEELRAGCTDAEAVASPRSYRVGGDGAGPSFFYDIDVSDRVDAFRRVRDNGPVADLAAQLMGSRALNRYFDNLFVKDGHGGAATRWHEDASYQRVIGQHSVNTWVSLDVIPRETALQFLAGSHRRDEPIYVMEHFSTTDAYDGPITADRTPMPPIADLRARFERVWWYLEPGDALVWYHRTLHAAPPNTLSTPRRSIAYVWTGDDARYDASPGRVDPDLADPDLAHGEPFLASVRFPRVR
ncbi:MAG: phytanoyl-CoA dioxygenase family protein [Actinomycetota bacterium]